MEEGDFARTKILTNLGSGGLPKIRKRRTKVSGGLLKNRKPEDSSQVGFQRTEKGEPLLRFISGGLPNNGKELRFIRVGLGWVSEERKKKTKIRKYIRILTDWLYFLDTKIGKFRRIASKLFFVPEY
ncbi:unnamed protein product [Rhizophagus irregularis]|nr:unnamed protein product [Rhizophagus irregularis]